MSIVYKKKNNIKSRKDIEFFILNCVWFTNTYKKVDDSK